MKTTGRIRIARKLGAALVVAVSSACHLMDADVYNLRELHQPDGQFRRSGALLGNLQYLLRFNLARFAANSDRYENPKIKPIKDPAGRSFEIVRDLSEYDMRDPQVRRVQIAWYAFLAVDSPWKLVRERCVLELGKIAEVLDLQVEPEPGTELATVETVSEALTQVLAGVNSIRTGGFEAGDSELAAGCNEIRGMLLSRRAALSVLRGISPLQDLVGADDPRFADLRILSFEVQEILVRRTIEAALRDPAPLVVVAGIRTSTKLFGQQVLGVFTSQLFGDEAEYDELVLLTVIELLGKQGLPAAPGGGDAARQLRFRYECINLLVDLGSSHPSGRVRLAALRALRENSAPDFGPREELWRPWWNRERILWSKKIDELSSGVTP